MLVFVLLRNYKALDIIFVIAIRMCSVDNLSILGVTEDPNRKDAEDVMTVQDANKREESK